MNRISSILLIIVIISASCSSSNSHKDNSAPPSIKQIIIKSYPTFHTRSLLICNPIEGDIIFDKLGNLEFIDENLNQGLTPYYYVFNKNEKSFLKDSILTNMMAEDFEGGDGQFLDGISTDIIFVSHNDKISKITLNNYSTENQARIIDFLFNLIINNCVDSVNIEYARTILDYHAH